MKQNTITGLIVSHKWSALMELIGTEEMVLKFPDPDSMESFRVRVMQTNAYGKMFNVSVNRKDRQIRISRCS